jgi:hypothetical protein
MWLSWRWGLVATLVLAGMSLQLRRSEQRPGLRALVNELALMFGLYTLWRICGSLSVMEVDGALARGRHLWHIERWLHLPNEATIQGWVLPHGWLVQFSNLYYAVAHAPALGIFLVWLFWRQRESYRPARTALVLTTFACLLIQLVPLAPPRMFPDLGFVDTAARYGQSVYAATVGPNSFNQLSAMPSVHVAWAVIIAWYTYTLSRSRWRYIGTGHAALTVVVVTVTANHWLADGIVATALFAVSVLIVDRVYGRRSAPIEPVPVPVPASVIEEVPQLTQSSLPSGSRSVMQRGPRSSEVQA